MTGLNKRFFLFIFMCIPIRLLLAYSIKYVKPGHLKYIGLISFIIAGLFILSYFNFNPRKKMGAFGGNIWWNDMRAVHGCVYLLFSLFAIKQNINAWKILVIDIIIGSLAFFKHYKMIFIK